MITAKLGLADDPAQDECIEAEAENSGNRDAGQRAQPLGKSGDRDQGKGREHAEHHDVALGEN